MNYFIIIQIKPELGASYFGVGRQFFLGVRRRWRPTPERRASDASTNFEKNWKMLENDENWWKLVENDGK